MSEESERQELAEQVGEQLRALYRQAAVLAAELSDATGMHPTDLHALRLLDAAAAQPLGMRRLGEALGLSSPAVTGLVDRLEAAGLVRRVRDTADRRRVRVELTDAARRFGEAQLAPVQRRIEAAVSRLGTAELAAASRLLERVLDEEGA